MNETQQKIDDGSTFGTEIAAQVWSWSDLDPEETQWSDHLTQDDFAAWIDKKLAQWAAAARKDTP